jgi:hypothetical protein
MSNKTFPILFDEDESRNWPKTWPKCARTVPLEAVAPFESQANRNHSQTLKRLAERGGLSPSELVAVMHGKGFYETWPRYVNGFWGQYREENRAPHPDILRAVLFVNALASNEDPHRMCDKKYCEIQRERVEARSEVLATLPGN